jgi:hypothetical protein
MALTPEQQRKYHQLKKKFGPDVAQQYDSWVQAGKPGGRFDPQNPTTPGAPAGAPPSVDFKNPQSVINYQGQMNDRAVDQSTPNVVNDFGQRKVERDPNTGKITVTEGLTGKNKELMEQGQAGQGMINSEFQKQMGFAAEQGKFDPRKGQIGQEAFDPNSVGKLPSWVDPRQTQIQAPGSFRDVQQQTYQNALQDYTSSVREDQSFRRDQLEQQMANEGVPRDSAKYQRAMAQFEKTANEGISQATRAAYRDSMDVGSQAFQNQLAGQGQEFNQNLQAGDQRFNQGFNARGQDAALQAQQFGQQSTLNDRAERMNQNEYMMPHNLAMGYMGAQGQYKDPNLGPTQSINVPQMDMLGYQTGLASRQQQEEQFRRSQEQQMEIARMNNATARQNGGGNSLNDRMALMRYEDELARNRYWEQQGGSAGQGPQQPGMSDVIGNGVGGFVNGLTNGIINNRGR